MDVKKITKEIVERITPTARPPEVDRVLDAINKQLRQRKLKAKAFLGGSFAKDTWLVGDHDVDIFVAFDTTYEDSRLSDLLAKAISFLKPQRVHGSRDYFQIDNHFLFEVIPVLAIKKPSDSKNITDFSLKHVGWVNSRSKKIKDDIRLAKKFCKAQRVYGAESYIRGFSGHVVDLIVIHYGGFMPLLRAASKWQMKTVIDTMNHHKGKALFALNKSKTTGPLVVVDPVQPDRNAAASLTDDNYSRFIHAAKMFIAKPSIQMFERKQVDFDELSKRGTLTKVRCTALPGSDDVAGTKILKLFEHLKKSISESGLTVTNSSWEWDKEKALLWFVTKEKTLPQTRKVEGPPIAIKRHAEAFKQKYKKTTIVKGRLVANVANELRTPREILQNSAKDPYAKEKAKQIRVE